MGPSCPRLAEQLRAGSPPADPSPPGGGLDRGTVAQRRIVCGKADRIDRARGPNPGIEVVDYKTGRCWIGDDEVRELISAKLYALAATRTFHEPVVRVRFVYVTEGTERSWSPEGDDLAAIEDELVELTEQVASDQLFEPRPAQMRCRWCKFAALCPAMDQASLEDLAAAGDAVF